MAALTDDGLSLPHSVGYSSTDDLSSSIHPSQCSLLGNTSRRPENARARRQANRPERNVLLPDAGKEAQMDFISKNVVGDGVDIATPFGQRKLTYADYTASGRSLLNIENMIRDSVMPLYANTHTTSSRTGRQTSKFREDARAMIASSVNADRQKDVVLFCGSGSTAAITKMLNRLKMSSAWKAEVGAGRKPLIIIGSHEHHSNILPWRESGATVVQCDETPEGVVDVSHLECILQHHAARRLKIGSFSAGSNVTGILSPTDTIASILHKHHALAFFDFAAAAPYIPIDVNNTRSDPLAYMDAAFVSPHKFVGGPQTPGVLVCKRRLMLESGVLDSDAPTVPGGGTVSFVTERDHRYVDSIEEREEGGTPDIIGAVRCGLVFRLKDEASAEYIAAREHEFVGLALARWGRNPRIAVLGSAEAERLSIVSFVVVAPRRDALVHHNLVCALLNDLFGIQARSGCACAGPYAQRIFGMTASHAKILEGAMLQGDDALKPGFTRVNFNYFLPVHIVHFIIDAVAFVADNAAAFVPLYRCNPRSGEWTVRPTLPPAVRALLPPPSPALAERSLEDASLLLSDNLLSAPPSSFLGASPSDTEAYLTAGRSLAAALRSLARPEPRAPGAASPLQPEDPPFLSPESASLRWFLLPSAAAALLPDADADDDTHQGRRNDSDAPLASGCAAAAPSVLPPHQEVFRRLFASSHQGATPRSSASTEVGAEVEPVVYRSHFEVFALLQQAAARARAEALGWDEGLGAEGARAVLREAAAEWRGMPEEERRGFVEQLPGAGEVVMAGGRKEREDGGGGRREERTGGRMGRAVRGWLGKGGGREGGAGEREGEGSGASVALKVLLQQQRAREAGDGAEDGKVGVKAGCLPRPQWMRRGREAKGGRV